MLRSICLLVRWHISIPPVRSKIWRERSGGTGGTGGSHSRHIIRYSIFMVWPSHVRLSITRHFQALFASAHEARKHAPITRAPKALLFFLSARSSTPGHLFTRMHSLLVDFARDSFAHRPIDWLACVYALTNCSAYPQAFVGLFRRFSDVRHRLISQFPSQTSKKRRLKEIE